MTVTAMSGTRRASIDPENYRRIYRMTAARLRAAQVKLAGRYLSVDRAAPDAPERLQLLMGGIAAIGGMLHEIEAIRL
jgi:hypothetical protein